MKSESIARLGIVFLLLCALPLRGERVEVPRISAEEQRSLVFAIGRIEIEDGELRLVDKQGFVLYAEPVSRVRTIVILRDGEGLNETPSPSLTAYPNPTSVSLYIEGAEPETDWRVFDMQGRLLMQGKGKEVNVSPLGQGDYLLQVKTSIFKFIKQ